MANGLVTMKVQFVGLDEAITAIEQCRQELQPARDRLVSMGWTPSMAETFIGEIAETVVRSLLKVD